MHSRTRTTEDEFPPHRLYTGFAPVNVNPILKARRTNDRPVASTSLLTRRPFRRRRLAPRRAAHGTHCSSSRPSSEWRARSAAAGSSARSPTRPRARSTRRICRGRPRSPCCTSPTLSCTTSSRRRYEILLGNPANWKGSGRFRSGRAVQITRSPEPPWGRARPDPSSRVADRTRRCALGRVHRHDERGGRAARARRADAHVQLEPAGVSSRAASPPSFSRPSRAAACAEVATRAASTMQRRRRIESGAAN